MSEYINLGKSEEHVRAMFAGMMRDLHHYTLGMTHPRSYLQPIKLEGMRAIMSRLYVALCSMTGNEDLEAVRAELDTFLKGLEARAAMEESQTALQETKKHVKLAIQHAQALGMHADQLYELETGSPVTMRNVRDGAYAWADTLQYTLTWLNVQRDPEADGEEDEGSGA
jgi:hypothetical protein